MFPVLFPVCSQSIPWGVIVFPVFRVSRVRYISWVLVPNFSDIGNTGNNGNKAGITMGCHGRHQEQIGNSCGNTIRLGERR